MSFFAVFDAATGAVKRAGSCSLVNDVALQAHAGEVVIATPGLVAADKFTVDVTKTPPALVAKA